MATSTRRRSALLALCLILLSAAVLLRWVAIDSDVPTSLPDQSAATWADEGYKTLASRNLLMFGQTHWNPADRYSGWLKESPITQLSFLAAFEIGGQGVFQARQVAAICFCLFLLGFVLLLSKPYGAPITMLGALALSTNYYLFIYSRLALFEIFIIVALYIPLFALRRRNARPDLKAMIVLGLASVIATFGLKASALLYFGPALLSMGLAWLAGERITLSVRTAFGLGAVLIGALVMAAITGHIWLERLNISPVNTIISALDNHLVTGGNVILAAAMLCSADLLIFRRQTLLESAYLTALVGIITIGPLIVGAFHYHPLRYWMPLLPASILLAVEWLTIVRAPVESAPAGTLPMRSSFTVLTMVAFGGVAGLVGTYWLIASLVKGWVWLGIVLPLDRKLLLLIALAVVAAAWWRRRVLADGRGLSAIAAVLLLAGIPLGIKPILNLVAHPIWERGRVVQALTSQLPHGASAAGDWAPELTLGTGVPALYLGGSGNVVERTPILRPTAFIHSGTKFDDKTLAWLSSRSDLRLGPPVDLGRYAGRTIRLYLLSYSR